MTRKLQQLCNVAACNWHLYICWRAETLFFKPDLVSLKGIWCRSNVFIWFQVSLVAFVLFLSLSIGALCAESIWGDIAYSYVSYNFSTLRWHWQLKTFLAWWRHQMKTFSALDMNGLCHGWWIPGDARSRDICSHVIDLVLQDNFHPSTTWVNVITTWALIQNKGVILSV